jgi:hypothetical protein
MKSILRSTIIFLFLATSLSAQNVYTVSVAANNGSLIQRADIANNPVIMISKLNIPVKSFKFLYLNSNGDLIEIPSNDSSFTQTMLAAIANWNVKYFWIDEAVFMLNGIQHTATSTKVELAE